MTVGMSEDVTRSQHALWPSGWCHLYFKSNRKQAPLTIVFSATEKDLTTISLCCSLFSKISPISYIPYHKSHRTNPENEHTPCKYITCQYHVFQGFFFFKDLFVFKTLFIYSWEKPRKRHKDIGRGRSRLPAGSPMGNSIPGPRDHDLGQRQMLNHWATQVPLVILISNLKNLYLMLFKFWISFITNKAKHLFMFIGHFCVFFYKMLSYPLLISFFLPLLVIGIIYI